MENKNKIITLLLCLVLISSVFFLLLRAPAEEGLTSAYYPGDVSYQPTITIGTTSQYWRGDETWQTLPTSAFSSFQSLVSQSGTGAPSGSTLQNSFGVTFTWARTGAGTYTLTASAATFTANKTAVLLSTPNNAFASFTYTITSTTVITFNTSVLSVLSLLLGSTNTDSLLANTLVEIRVYP